jgi:hypothetical protein
MGYILTIIVISLLLFVFWLFQLTDLMGRKDEEFVGRYDKVLWFMVVFFGNFVGAAIYMVCKPRRLAGSMYARLKGSKSVRFGDANPDFAAAAKSDEV